MKTAKDTDIELFTVRIFSLWYLDTSGHARNMLLKYESLHIEKYNSKIIDF